MGLDNSLPSPQGPYLELHTHTSREKFETERGIRALGPSQEEDRALAAWTHPSTTSRVGHPRPLLSGPLGHKRSAQSRSWPESLLPTSQPFLASHVSF